MLPEFADRRVHAEAGRVHPDAGAHAAIGWHVIQVLETAHRAAADLRAGA